MIFNKKQLLKELIKYSVWAIIALSLSIIIILILSGRINKIAKDMEDARTAEAILNRRVETISNLRAGLEASKTNYKKILETIPPADNPLGFLTSMEEITSKYRITQSIRFRPLPEGGVQSIQEVEYDLIITANISTLINYLEDVENLNFVSGITSISLSNDATWNNLSSISMKGILLVRSPEITE